MVNWDAYLEPPDYGSEELSVTETVHCQNEDCTEFEKDVEWSDVIEAIGNSWSSYSFTIDYRCPTCSEDSSFDFDRDSDYYDNMDIAHDTMKEER